MSSCEMPGHNPITVGEKKTARLGRAIFAGTAHALQTEPSLFVHVVRQLKLLNCHAD